MELYEYLRLLWRRKRLILILTVTGMFAAYGLTFTLDETYEATTVVLVKPQHTPQFIAPGDTKLLDIPVGRTMAVETPAKTYIEVIKSRHLREAIVRDLNLDEEEEETGALADFKEALRNSIHTARDLVKYGRRFEKGDFEEALEEVLENIDMEATTDTYIFEITYIAPTAEEAASVANTAARLFVKYSTDASQEETREYRKYLQDRLAEINEHLEKATTDLKTFKSKQKTFSLAEEYQERLDILADLELDLERNQVQLAGLRMKYAETSPDVQSVLAEKQKLEEAVAARREALEEFPTLEKRQLELELEADAAQSAYDFVRKEYHQALIAERQAASEIRVVSPAAAPKTPAGPKRLRYAAAACIAGLMVGVGLAFFLEYIDSSIRSTADVKRVLDLPVLATIPTFDTSSS